MLNRSFYAPAPTPRPPARGRRCRPPRDAPPRRRRRRAGGGRRRRRCVGDNSGACRRVARRLRATRRRSSNDVAPVRIGLVGCGRLAELGYIPALARVHGAQLVAVADPDPIRRDPRLRASPPRPARRLTRAPMRPRCSNGSHPTRRAGHAGADAPGRRGAASTPGCRCSSRNPRARRRARPPARGVDATAVDRVQPSLRPGRGSVCVPVTGRGRRRPPPRDRLPPAQLGASTSPTTRCSTSGPTSSTGPAGSPGAR